MVGASIFIELSPLKAVQAPQRYRA